MVAQASASHVLPPPDIAIASDLKVRVVLPNDQLVGE